MALQYKSTWLRTWAIENTKIVLFQINRNYSCSHSTVGTTLWTENTVNNKTEYDINLDFIPNVQYIIQVVPITTGSFSLDDENVVFVQTESSSKITFRRKNEIILFVFFIYMIYSTKTGTCYWQKPSSVRYQWYGTNQMVRG